VFFYKEDIPINLNLRQEAFIMDWKDGQTGGIIS
jgi:hypothetical protein